MNPNRRFWALLSGVAAVALLMGCCGGAGTVMLWYAIPGSPAPITPAAAVAPAAAGANRVTLKHFQAIPDMVESDGVKPRFGVSYGKVVSIIGFEGTSVARNEAAMRQSFIWSNPDGSNLVCEFDTFNDELRGKKQDGLR